MIFEENVQNFFSIFLLKVSDTSSVIGVENLAKFRPYTNGLHDKSMHFIQKTFIFTTENHTFPESRPCVPPIGGFYIGFI